MYSPAPPAYSAGACSGLLGHTLTVMRGLELVAARHASGEAVGSVMIVEDDAALDPYWEARRASPRAYSAEA